MPSSGCHGWARSSFANCFCSGLKGPRNLALWQRWSKTNLSFANLPELGRERPSPRAAGLQPISPHQPRDLTLVSSRRIALPERPFACGIEAALGAPGDRPG